jgi:colanic acid biosynthesis glycosyl transferase WcaI
MAEHVGRLGVADTRIRLIPNWADGSLLRPEAHDRNPLRAAWGLEDAFVVAYSGNLGRAHDDETLIEAIAETQAGQAAVPYGTAPPQIRWLFIGGGAGYEALRREVHRRKLGSVRFEPYQPRDRLSHSLSAADLHLVSLRPELEGLIVPSKIYGIGAVGRPAIFIGDPDGEVARHLADHDCGATVSGGDGTGLARTLLRLAADPARCRQMGENARRAFEATFEKRHAVRRWKRLLEEIAGKS